MPSDSASAVDEIVRTNADRDPKLVAIKYDRMAENVFAFFRGTDHLFVGRWSQFRPTDAGPAILICGDLHLENFGAYQTEKGDFRFDINDFDEAAIAPCSFDVVRAVASILLAAEVWKVSAVPASRMVIAYLAAYRAAVIDSARDGKIGATKLGEGEGPIFELLGETALGDRAAMLDKHTEKGHHGARRIKRSDDKHPEVSEKKVEQVREAIEAYGRTTATPEAFHVLDVTGRIAGVGSLGVRRYTVLIAGGATPETNRLLDVKEAITSCIPGNVADSRPLASENDAARVVAAQRQLQSEAAEGLAAIEINGRFYRVREMVPDENRSKLDRLQKKHEKLRSAMAVAGQLTAWAHVRGCQVAQNENRQKNLATWVESPAFDAAVASAARCVDLTFQDYEAFVERYKDHHINPGTTG